MHARQEMSASFGDVMSSPNFFPVRMDLARKVVWFVRLSRDDYRDLPFLDSRALRPDSQMWAVNIDDLLLHDANVPPRSAPRRYIFHPAFACSTLLARYLDLIPGCFVLKEPNLLTQVASLKPTRSTVVPESEYAEIASEWSHLLGAVIRLLTRRYHESDVVIIKAHDACNGLGEDLLKDNHECKILFLSITLRVFLLSVLKTPQRRGWLRARVGRAIYDATRFRHLANVDPTDLADAQAGAYLWLLNSNFCGDLQERAPDRISILCGANVADSPEVALGAVVNFFGLPFTTGRLESILSDPSVAAHSKDSSVAYDSAARNRDLAQAEASFGIEINQGVEWCRQVGHDAGSDWPLG